MQKTFVILFCVLLFISCTGRRLSSSKVPSVVLNTVKASYPEANSVEWKKLDTNYEAEISVNDSTEASARVTADGRILMRKLEIPSTEIPAVLQELVKTNYGIYDIDDVERVEKDGLVYYQMELEAKGKKDLELVFTIDGKPADSIPYWD
jgi:hypothetical protein